MDWKEMTEITELPDEGTFNMIRRRLVLRRTLRIGVPVLGVLALAAVVLWPSTGENKGDVMSKTGLQPQTVVAVNEPASAKEASSADRISVPTDKTQEDVVETIDVDKLMPDANLKVAHVQPPIVESWTKGECPFVVRPLNDGLADSAATETVIPDIVITTEPDLSTPAPKAGEPQPEPYHEDDLIWSPNIITPNGDVDENRFFSIKSSSTLDNFLIHIYNRRGQRVFSSTDPNFIWDATHDGAAVPQGAYVWVASFRDSDGQPHTVNGTVVVVK